MEQNIDKLLEIKIINTFISLPDLMDKANIDYREDSNFFCPFHFNENTPSAHLYLNPGDGGKIWCYSEQKMYGSWDFIKNYFPDVNTNVLAERYSKRARSNRGRKIFRSFRVR